MHDERYRTVFAFPRMVEDLLRGFAARERAVALDFSTLRKLPAEYVSDERLVRRGDTVELFPSLSVEENLLMGACVDRPGHRNLARV